MREEVDYLEASKKYANDKYVNIEPWVDRIDHIRLTIFGKEGTPYEGGKFVFEIKCGSSYPYVPPYVFCQTLIWHPNIDSSMAPGKSNICLDLINPDLVGKVDAKTGASGWTPAKTLTNIIESLRGMIHMEPPFYNPSDPLNNKAGEQALNNPKAFAKEAKKWTEKYASR
ncbi:MAG: ubiquitin-conjugating enzyme E2 [Candidatus Helarchaeota archaeon]